MMAFAFVLVLAGCRSPNPAEPRNPAIASTPTAPSSTHDDTTPLALIPAPYSLQPKPGYFELRDGAVIRVRVTNAEITAATEWLRDMALRTRGLHLKVETMNPPGFRADFSSGAGIDVLMLKPASKDGFADEDYYLDVSEQGITIGTSSGHGAFNAATTLWQLLTLDGKTSGPARIPNLRIDDRPRFKWRGLMLDSARHLQSVEYIKQFIDAMALHKYNVLHWHLTDDQGWRVEIKRYPKLTEVGAWRRPPGHAGTDADGRPTRYGGYYTQAQIREIVAYAQARYVTIVPEIEMPGHAQAAIAAYPELGVTGRNPGVSHDWGVHTYLYNVDDSTFIFLENVLGEVMELFPSRYIHIGGDEAAKDQWQASARVQARMRGLGLKNEAALQAWFTTRIEKFLAAHGRKLLGWDEILEGGLPPQATVMSWRGIQGAVEAAKQGHDVVLSPDPDLYFNNLPSDLPDEPAGRAHVISLQSVYAFDPLPHGLDSAAAAHVLGAQANLWSEYLPTDASVSYAAWPRAAALAEVLWSPPAAHDWNGFLARLATQQVRYRQLGVGYADSAFAVRIDVDPATQAGQATIGLSNQTGFGAIRYTLDGSEPMPTSPRYTEPFSAPAQGAIRASAFERGHMLAQPRARALDAAALRRRSAGQLMPCRVQGGVQLRLPDDRAANNHRRVYPVEIFDPCWLWPKAELGGIDAIEVAAAALPYNFQLWKDIKSVVAHTPTRHAGGELQVHLDHCDGTLVATAALAGGRANAHGLVELDAALAPLRGKHDLCLRFATGKHDPLWVIDNVQLRAQSKTHE